MCQGFELILGGREVSWDAMAGLSPTGGHLVGWVMAPAICMRSL